MTYPLFYTFHFYLFGVIAVASAITFVTRRSPVAAALWLVTTLFSLAAMYVMLDAPFIGAIQVLIYAGAIMVVFLFVIMLLNLGHTRDVSDTRGLWVKLAAAGLGLALLSQLLVLSRVSVPEGLLTPLAEPPRALVPAPVSAMAPEDIVAPFAEALFRDSLLAFQIAGVLLLVAIVAAVVLAKPRS